MTYVVRLQKWFAVGWLIWLTWLLAVTFLPLDVWWSRTMFVAWFCLEAWGHFRHGGGMGDTLSEFMQWFAALGRKEGHSPVWWKSWPVMAVTVLLGLVTYQAVWVASYWREPWDNPVRGAIVGIAVFLWNFFHWTNPEKYG